MAATLDLRALGLVPGAAVQASREVRVDPPALGGQPGHAVPAAPLVRVDVGESVSGRDLRLRMEVAVEVACARCLGPARVALTIDTREFQGVGRTGEPFDEDLDCAYLEGDLLDLEAWVRDAVADELPMAVLCRADCGGLCATCGARRDDGPCGCRPASGDVRWQALDGLAERLRASAG